MSISNFNLRKRLGMKLAQDDGAGNGGAGSETNPTDGAGGEGEGTETNPTEEKTEAQKQSEALTNAEKAKQDAEERANTLEAKVTCLSKGVLADSVDDVVILAKAMVSDDVTMDQAVDKVLEKYPSFKGVQQQEENKGFKIGAGGEKQKGNVDDVLARAFGNK